MSTQPLYMYFPLSLFCVPPRVKVAISVRSNQNENMTLEFHTRNHFVLTFKERQTLELS